MSAAPPDQCTVMELPARSLVLAALLLVAVQRATAAALKDMDQAIVAESAVSGRQATRRGGGRWNQAQMPNIRGFHKVCLLLCCLFYDAPDLNGFHSQSKLTMCFAFGLRTETVVCP